MDVPSVHRGAVRGDTMTDQQKFDQTMWDRMEAVVEELKAQGYRGVVFGAIKGKGQDVFSLVCTGGDYRFDGTVVAVFPKLSGVVRYVVEDDRGVLHIYSEKNLRSKPGVTGVTGVACERHVIDNDGNCLLCGKTERP